MEEYNRNCLMLNDSIDKLVNEFTLKYYGEDAHIIRIDWRMEEVHYNFQINDDCRNLSEAYTALRYDIPEKILLRYLDERLDKALKSEPMINLENYFKLFKNVPNDNNKTEWASS